MSQIAVAKIRVGGYLLIGPALLLAIVGMLNLNATMVSCLISASANLMRYMISITIAHIFHCLPYKNE